MAISSKEMVYFFRVNDECSTISWNPKWTAVALHNSLEDRSNAMWLIGNGAHRTPAIFDLLSEHFNDSVIDLYNEIHTRSDVPWPPFSGFDAIWIFSLVCSWKICYAVKLDKQLRNWSIYTECEAIPTEIFGRVSGYFCLRLHLDLIQQSNR